MQDNKDLSFVFMDESGQKESDRFFVCGFLQIEDNIKFVQALSRVVDQIKNLSINNRQQRVEILKQSGEIEQLYNLAKTFNEFELKYYLISKENKSLYSDLIEALWSKTNFKFTAIVFDRHDENYARDINEHAALYLKSLKMYTMYCVDKIKYVYIPDNFDINFKWNVNSGNLPVAILPLESNASLQIQICDILTGLVGQALRSSSGASMTKKDIVRKPVLKTLEERLGKKIDGKFTVNSPHYFNVWPVKLRQKEKSGHGQETQPRL